jgi:putative ABC transport system permease protein
MLIAGVAAISLLVAGIGILAVMLISVRERTLEIGVRRAVGAKKRDILTQFIVESLLLSLNGGIVGILLGMIISYAVSLTSKWDLIVPNNIIIISFFVALFIGMFFGVYPARKAAALNPIDALKCE